jgi:hypothetical protein
LRLVGSEMEAGMHDDPLGAEPWRNLDIGLEITINASLTNGATSATLTAEEVCRPCAGRTPGARKPRASRPSCLARWRPRQAGCRSSVLHATACSRSNREMQVKMSGNPGIRSRTGTDEVGRRSTSSHASRNSVCRRLAGGAKGFELSRSLQRNGRCRRGARAVSKASSIPRGDRGFESPSLQQGV